MKWNSWEQNYLMLCDQVLTAGIPQDTRAGQTVTMLGAGLSISMNAPNEFPLLTTRKMFYKPAFGELAAFLRGHTYNGKFMELGCNYWTPNARAWKCNEHAELDENLWLGRIYGYQWRKWGAYDSDQLENSRLMIETDPDSRRNVITAWNPDDLTAMCLPPCHILMQWHVLGSKLHLTVYMRSVDLCLGLPTDIILYYTLLVLMARDTRLPVGDLHFTFGNAHVYEGHREALFKQLSRTLSNPPTFELLKLDATGHYIDQFLPRHLIINEYKHEEAIKYDLYA